MNFSLTNIIHNFRIDGTIENITSFGQGHIHDTYLVKTKESDMQNYILQRINHKVFKNVGQLMENISNVTGHLLKKSGYQAQESLALVNTVKGNSYYKDSDGNYWRVFIFIKDGHIYQRISDPAKAFEAGKAIGEFQYKLSDLQKDLFETVPGFHNLEKRLIEFNNAKKQDPLDRATQVKAEITFVEERTDTMVNYWNNLKKGHIPLRITHNDTKVNNILFDQHDHAICLIDLDTVMPGYVHFDFGDAIRTLANTADEDEPDPDKVNIDLVLFSAFTKGYLLATRAFITEKEKEFLAYSPLYMTFIIGLRFLTDYINGDIYFTIHDPDQNLKRARTQFKLLLSMEDNLDITFI